jgi:hypothetical protein
MQANGCSYVSQIHNTPVNALSEFIEDTNRIRLNTERKFSTKNVLLSKWKGLVVHEKLLVVVRVHGGRSWKPLLLAISCAFTAGSKAEGFGRRQSFTSSTSATWTSYDNRKQIYKTPNSALLYYAVLSVLPNRIPMSLLIHDSQGMW